MTNRPVFSFYYCSPPLKTQPDLDEVRSNSTQRTGPFSLSSPLSLKSTVQRVNQIKPKPKIKMPPSSQVPKPPPIRKIYTQPPEAAKEVEVPVVKLEPQAVPSKSKQKEGGLLSWMKFEFLCGMGATSRGKQSPQGCTCPPPCPVRQYWLGAQQQSDAVTYSQLRQEKPSPQAKAQIQKDIGRTYPTTLTFTNPVFLQRLSEVLTVYSVYDMEVGYVQGMNTLAAILLFHLKETEATFWALVELMECHELRLNYLPDLQQLKEHCEGIEKLIGAHFPQLKTHASHLGVDLKLILHGWLLTLMSKIIPLQQMHTVLGHFRRQGWRFVYKLVLVVVRTFKEGLLLAEDEADFVMALGEEACRQLALEWEQLIESARVK